MSDNLNGIPLYQLMEIHRHIHTLKEVFPVLDPLNAVVPGSHSMSELRKMLDRLTGEDLVDFAHAVAGLIGCDRVVGMAEVRLLALGKGARLERFDEIAPTEDGS